jgi:hypothetical protein
MVCCLCLKLSSEIQLWLIRRPNCINNFILTFFYLYDLAVYSIRGPKEFLQARSKKLGKNFAALGRIIVGEYSEVADLIQSPQNRSHFLGRARLYPSGFSKKFPLFLSDADAMPIDKRPAGAAGGSSMISIDIHSALHNHIWRDVSPAAHAMMKKDEAAFRGYLKEGVKRSYKQKSDVQKEEIQKMTIRCILHAFLGTPMGTDHGGDKDKNDQILQCFYALFFSTNPLTNIILTATKPLFPGMIFSCPRNAKVRQAVKFILQSPLMEDYEPNEDNANLPKEEYARLLLDILGIAGMIGTSNLLIEVLTSIPDHASAEIDTDDRHDIARAVLEAARARAPVNTINTILPKEKTIVVNGKEKSIAAGTVVAGSIGLACLDPGTFPNPDAFDHHRENLLEATVIFNSVGYEAEGAGKRTCPGRTVAMEIACEVLILQREAALRSRNGKDMFDDNHPSD